MADKPPIDVEHKMMLIGLLCFHWSFLEFLLAAAIWRILGIDEESGKIVTGGLDIEPRAAMAVRLAKQRKLDPELIEALTNAQTTISDAVGERNLAVHGVYGLNPKTGETFAEVHRGKFRGQRQEMTTDRLGTLVSSIDKEIERLRPVLQKFKIIDDRETLALPTRPPR